MDSSGSVCGFGFKPFSTPLVLGANGSGRTGQPDGSCWRKSPNRQSAPTCSRVSHFQHEDMPDSLPDGRIALSGRLFKSPTAPSPLESALQRFHKGIVAKRAPRIGAPAQQAQVRRFVGHGQQRSPTLHPSLLTPALLVRQLPAVAHQTKVDCRARPFILFGFRHQPRRAPGCVPRTPSALGKSYPGILARNDPADR